MLIKIYILYNNAFISSKILIIYFNKTYNNINLYIYMQDQDFKNQDFKNQDFKIRLFLIFNKNFLLKRDFNETLKINLSLKNNLEKGINIEVEKDLLKYVLNLKQSFSKILQKFLKFLMSFYEFLLWLYRLLHDWIQSIFQSILIPIILLGVKSGFFQILFHSSEIGLLGIDYLSYILDTFYIFKYLSIRHGKCRAFGKIFLKFIASPIFLLKILLICIGGDKTVFFKNIRYIHPFFIQRSLPIRQVFQFRIFLDSVQDLNLKYFLDVVFNNFNLILFAHLLCSIFKNLFKKIDAYSWKLIGIDDSVEMNNYVKKNQNLNKPIRLLKKSTDTLNKLFTAILSIYALIFIVYSIKTIRLEFDFFKFLTTIYQIKEDYTRELLLISQFSICIFVFYHSFRLIKENFSELLKLLLYFVLYFILLDLLKAFLP